VGVTVGRWLRLKCSNVRVSAGKFGLKTRTRVHPLTSSAPHTIIAPMKVNHRASASTGM
jgi:hypothetical protein